MTEFVRKSSRALFGNRHKLEVLAAIARGGRHFYVQQVAHDTGIPSQTVRPIVLDLVGTGVEELPHVGSATAPHYFERQENPAWDFAAGLLVALTERGIALQPARREAVGKASTRSSRRRHGRDER